MRNSNSIEAIKERDTLNRRQEPRKATSFHDITLSRYFTIGDAVQRYTMKSRSYTNDYAVYTEGDSIECIGFAEPDRNKVKLIVRRHGIDWTSRIALSDITCYGKN